MALKKIKEVIEVAVKGGGAANRSLKTLDQTQDKASKSANNLEKKDRHLAKAAMHLAKALDQTTAAQTRSDKAQQKSAKQATRLKKSIQGLGQALTAAGGAAQAFSGVSGALTGIARTLSKPIGVAVAFEKDFAMVKTLTDQAGVDLERGLIDLAKSLPFSVSDVTKSAYAAISAGVKAPDVVSFLEAASKAAIGTGSDLKSTVALLTAAVNAFGNQGETAATIADKMQMTIKNAVLSGQDLQSIFGMLAPAASLGASVDEVLALTGALTKIGIKPHMAAVRVNAMIKELTRTTGHAHKAFKRLGVETGVTAIQQKGLTAILQEVQEKTRGSAGEIKKLSNNVRATSGFLGILGDNFDEFMYQVEANADSAGAHIKAAEIVGKTAQGAINRFQATVDVVMQKLGDDLLPEVTKFMERLTKALENNRDALKDTFVTTMEMFFKLGNWLVSNADRVVAALTSMAKAAAFAVRAVSSTVSVARRVSEAVIPGMSTARHIQNLAAERERQSKKRKAEANKREKVDAKALPTEEEASRLGFETPEQLAQAREDFKRGFYLTVDASMDGSDRSFSRKASLLSADDIANAENDKAAEIINKNMAAIKARIVELNNQSALERVRLEKAENELNSAQKGLRKTRLTKHQPVLLKNAEDRLKEAKRALEVAKKQTPILDEIRQLNLVSSRIDKEFAMPLKRRIAAAERKAKPALATGPTDKQKKRAEKIAKLNREIEAMRATAAANMSRIGRDGTILSGDADINAKMDALAAKQEKILGDYMAKGKGVNLKALFEAFEDEMSFLEASERNKPWTVGEPLEDKMFSEMKKESDQFSKKIKEQTRNRLKRMAEIEGDPTLMQFFNLDDQYAKDRRLFAGHTEMMLVIEKEYQRKRHAITSKFNADRARVEHDSNAATASSIGSTIQSVEALGEAIGASTGVMAAIQSALLLSRGAYHTFMGFSELASAASATAGGPPHFFPNPAAATAHKFAATSHFLAAGTATIQAGKSAFGGGSGAGSSAGRTPPSARLNVNESRSALNARERNPGITFGDIVLSDVPALLSKSGSKALGQQIAGHVAQELGRRSNIQGTVRINRRAIRGT